MLDDRNGVICVFDWIYSVPNIMFCCLDQMAQNLHSKLSGFVTFLLTNSMHASISRLPSVNFTTESWWRGDDIVEVYTGSTVLGSEHSKPFSRFWTPLWQLPFLPAHSIWKKGLILIVSRLWHIFSHFVIMDFTVVLKRFKVFFFFITFSNFFLLTTLISKLHRQFLGRHDNSTYLICHFNWKTSQRSEIFTLQQYSWTQVDLTRIKMYPV